MQALIFVFQLTVLIFSVMIHEIAHGVVAERFGDATARRMGRLTLNPLKHIDWYGSVLFPLFMALASGGRMVFGWAKPVPVNTANLKNPDRDTAFIAAAGPLSNFALAFVFALFSRGLALFADPSAYVLVLGELFSLIVITNLSLALFNLMPIPPLDGSNILFAFLPPSAYRARAFLEQYGFIMLIAFIAFGFPIIAPVIGWFYSVFMGA